MIGITLTTAITLYLFLSVSLIFAGWFYSQWKPNRSIHPDIGQDQHTLTCEFCGFISLAHTLETVHRCPQCQLWNSQIASKSNPPPKSSIGDT